MILQEASKYRPAIPSLNSSWYPRIVAVCVAICIAAATIVLIGWLCHIKVLVTLGAGMPGMSMATSLSFLIVSAAIISLRWKTPLNVFLAAGVGVIALAALGQFLERVVEGRGMLVHTSAAIGHAFPTNVMSPNTATLFLLLALALATVDRPIAPNNFGFKLYAFQILALAVSLIALLSLIGFFLGKLYLSGITHVAGTGVSTAILFIVSSTAILFSRPTDGVMTALRSSSAAGYAARLFLPVMSIAPLLLGCGTMIALQVHLFQQLYFAFLVIVTSMILLAGLILTNISALQYEVKRVEDYQQKIASFERQQIVSDLEVTQDKLKLAVDGAQLGTWHWNLVTDQLEWSEQTKRLFGIDPTSEVTLEHMTNGIHPDDRARVHKARADAVQGNENYAAEYRVVWPDGSVHWLDSRGKVYRGADGTPLHFEGIVQETSVRHQTQDREKQFVKDVLASVTEAKLTLCFSEDELPQLLKPVGREIKLDAENGGIRELRNYALEVCKKVAQPEEKCLDMQTAVGEAAMNAVVHAKNGVGQIFADDNGTVQVKVTDHGGGIALSDLPNATLRRGYTTAGTLGHGMKMMLQTVDRVYIMTGPTGTTVFMEQDRIDRTLDW